MLKFKHDTLLFYYGGFIVEDKRHYKLYKHGKLWCCTAITIASLTIETVVLHANVQADSNQPATTQVVSSSSTEVMANQPATATTENEVPLDQTTVNNNYAANDACLDHYQVTTDENNQNVFQASGWHASGQSNNERYRYAILYDNTTRNEIARQRIAPLERPDVQAAYPHINNSRLSGFDINFVLPNNISGHTISLVTRYSNDAVNGEGQRTDFWFSPIIIDNTNRANLDTLAADQNGKLHVGGWHASNQAMGKKYHYIIIYDLTSNHEIARQLVTPVQRPDVAQAFPTIGNAHDSGFDVTFKLTPQYSQGNLSIISRWTNDPVGNGDDTTDFWFAPVQKNNQGWLDSYNLSKGQLTVSGWHANDAAIYQPYHYLILFDNTAQTQVASDLVPTDPSPDVAKANPNTRSAYSARFNYQFGKVDWTAGHTYSLVSRYSISNQGNGDDGTAADHTDFWFPAMTLNQHAAYIDNYQIDSQNMLNVSGWYANDNAVGKNYAYVIILQDGHEINRQQVTMTYRQDVAAVFPTIYNSAMSGFTAAIQLPATAKGNLSFVLRFSDQSDGEGNYADIYTQPISNGFMHNRMVLGDNNQAFYYDDQGQAANNFIIDGILYRTDGSGNVLNTIKDNTNSHIGQISFTGDLTGINKDNRKPVQISVKLTDGTSIDGWATIKWQGNSSIAWPKKGYRLKLFKDQAMTKKLKIKLPGSGFKTNSFNLKACFTDPTAGLNIVNAELFKQITASRSGLADSIVNDMPNYGQIAGLPLELGINNLDQGLYVLETYQEDKLYNLDDKLADNIALSDNQSDMSTFTQPFTADDLVDTAFNNRSPKKVDQSVVDRFNQLYQLANASDAEYYNLEKQYLDVPAAIDYLTFISAINDVDGITKNITYISKAGSKWVLMPYDLDMTWNNLYNGETMSINANMEDLLNNYQQRLLLTIYKHHRQDVIDRYQALRQNVLSTANVTNLFNQWFNKVGSAAYQNDDTLWSDISVNNGRHPHPVNVTDFDNMISQRLNNVDHFFGLA